MSRSRAFAVGQILYALAAVAVVALAASVKTDGYVANILMQAATYAIAVFGLSIVLGLCGQINLAQAAFFALGAYAVGLGGSDYHLPFWLCLLGGMALAAAAGAGLGVSTLRLGGHYLAMVTISFQQILTVVLINAIPVTHGPDGVSSIARPAGFQSGQAFLALVVAVLALSGYLVWRLADTRLGRAMRAVRDNELAAGAAGVDVFRTKLIAFALCALLGGLGGGLFAAGFSYISPDQFAFSDSIVLLTMALLGGVASPIGSAIGTILLILIPEWLRFLKSVPGLYLAIYGAAVILIVIFMPEGIWGFIRRLFASRARAAPAARRRRGERFVVCAQRGISHGTTSHGRAPSGMSCGSVTTVTHSAAAKTSGKARLNEPNRGTTRVTAASARCSVAATAIAGAATRSAACISVAGSASANCRHATVDGNAPGATRANESANAKTSGTQPSSSRKAARNEADHSRPKPCALVTFAPGTLPRTPR